MHSSNVISIFPELGRKLDSSDLGKHMVAVRPFVDLECRIIRSDLIPRSLQQAEADAFVYISFSEIFHNGRVQRLNLSQINAPVYMLLTDFIKVAAAARKVLFDRAKAMSPVNRIIVRVVYPTLGKSYKEYKDGDRLVRTYPRNGVEYDHIPYGTMQDPFMVARLKITDGIYTLTVPYFNKHFTVADDNKYLSIQEFNELAITSTKEEHMLANGQLIQIKKLSA